MRSMSVALCAWSLLAAGGIVATAQNTNNGEMVLIPAGSFEMGDTFNEGDKDERPVHPVDVDEFYAFPFEVTNQQYAEALNWALDQGGLIVIIDGSVYPYDGGMLYLYCDTTTSHPYSRITWNGSTFGVIAGKENHPMVMVSWYGAAAYANWRSEMEGRPLYYDVATWENNENGGYRLSTEAEWEKAARGGVVNHRFPWSDSNNIQHTRANYYSFWANGTPYYLYDTSATQGYHPDYAATAEPRTAPVGSFAPNDYGLYDLAGNVGEWCNDWFDPNLYSTAAATDPNLQTVPALQDARVIRGGSWITDAVVCRVAERNSAAPGFRNNSTGFRIVASILEVTQEDSSDTTDVPEETPESQKEAPTVAPAPQCGAGGVPMLGMGLIGLLMIRIAPRRQRFGSTDTM